MGQYYTIPTTFWASHCFHSYNLGHIIKVIGIRSFTDVKVRHRRIGIVAVIVFKKCCDRVELHISRNNRIESVSRIVIILSLKVLSDEIKGRPTMLYKKVVVNRFVLYNPAGTQEWNHCLYMGYLSTTSAHNHGSRSLDHSHRHSKHHQ